MNFRGDISGKDKIETVKLLMGRYQKSRNIGLATRLVNILLSVAFWVVLAFLIANLSGNFDKYAGFISYMAILIGISFLLSMVGTKHESSMLDSYLNESVTFDFAEDRLSISSDSGIETILRYSRIIKVEEVSKMLVFFVSEYNGVLMPLSFFQGETQKQQLVSFVESKLEKPVIQADGVASPWHE